MRSWAIGHARAHGPHRGPNLLHETAQCPRARCGWRRRPTTFRATGTPNMFSVSTGQYTELGAVSVQPVVLNVLHHADHLAPGILTQTGRAEYACRARPRARPQARERNPRKSGPRGRPSRCRSKSRRVRRSAACPWLRNTPARRGSICATAGCLPAPTFGLRPRSVRCGSPASIGM